MLTQQRAKKERLAPVFVFIVLIIIAAAAFGGWYWWKGQQATAQQPTPLAKKPVTAKPPVTQTTEVNAGAAAAVIPPPQPNVAPALSRREPAGEPVLRPKPVLGPKPVLRPKFTIQVELVCQQASLKKAVDIGGANVWSVPITYRGQQCYRVFWGQYDTRQMAESTIAQIPAALRGSKPVVVAAPPQP
jgi:septal ring-binding cell division protein DamX